MLLELLVFNNFNLDNVLAPPSSSRASQMKPSCWGMYSQQLPWRPQAIPST